MCHEKCAVVGIISKNKSKQVAGLIYNSLLALQHRGQESAGIATVNGLEIKVHKKPGLVANVFTNNSFQKFKLLKYNKFINLYLYKYHL